MSRKTEYLMFKDIMSEHAYNVMCKDIVEATGNKKLVERKSLYNLFH